MFYGDVKSAWEPLEMQAWLTKQSKQALGFAFYCIGCTSYVRHPSEYARSVILNSSPRSTVLLSLLT